MAYYFEITPPQFDNDLELGQEFTCEATIKVIAVEKKLMTIETDTGFQNYALNEPNITLSIALRAVRPTTQGVLTT